MSDQKDKSNEPEIQDKIIFFIIAIGIGLVIFIFIYASKDIGNNTNTSSGNYTNYRSLHDELTSGCSKDNDEYESIVNYYCNNKPWWRVNSERYSNGHYDYVVYMKSPINMSGTKTADGEYEYSILHRTWVQGQYYCYPSYYDDKIPCSEQEFLNYIYTIIDYKTSILNYLSQEGIDKKYIEQLIRGIIKDDHTKNLLYKLWHTRFEDLNESPF